MYVEGRGGGEDLGGVEGAEAIVNIYRIRKEFIFNKGGERISSSCLFIEQRILFIWTFQRQCNWKQL